LFKKTPRGKESIYAVYTENMEKIMALTNQLKKTT